MKTLATLLLFNLFLTACIQDQKCVRSTNEQEQFAKTLTSQKEIRSADYRKMKPLRKSPASKDRGIIFRTLDCITK